MPNDKTTAPTKPRPSLAAMFAETNRKDYVTQVASIPPSASLAPRSEPVRGAVDLLSTAAKIWELMAPGGAGKTTLARYLAGNVLERGLQDQTVLAALDPGSRALAQYFPNVMQPPSADANATAVWLQEILKFCAKNRVNGILDFGGGDRSKLRLLELASSIAEIMERDGAALIAAYVLSPRIDDIAPLQTFEAKGFRPRATALILNLGRAESPAAFDAIRRQPAYRAARDRGAVELWMPKLEPESLALEIELGRIHFHDARDGTVHEGQGHPDISLIERIMVREWLERMDEAFASVRTWLPWS